MQVRMREHKGTAARQGNNYNKSEDLNQEEMEGMKAKGRQVNGLRGSRAGQHHAVGMEVLEGGQRRTHKPLSCGSVLSPSPAHPTRVCATRARPPGVQERTVTVNGMDRKP